MHGKYRCGVDRATLSRYAKIWYDTPGKKCPRLKSDFVQFFLQYQTTSDWQDRGGGVTESFLFAALASTSGKFFSLVLRCRKKKGVSYKLFPVCLVRQKKETRESVVFFVSALLNRDASVRPPSFPGSI